MRTPPGWEMSIDAKITAARAFVRSLNILLKFGRLYGFDHARTAQQFKTAWGELRTAVPPHADSGMLLGASGSQLLLDGVPLETAPAERSFAQLLSAAGLASIHFSAQISEDDLERFVRAFPTGGSKPAVLAEQLKAALAGTSGIRINEIRFFAADASLSEGQVAAQLTAQALGADSEQFKSWLNDPHKLLQLIAAAQGSKGAGGSGSGVAATATAVAEAAPSVGAGGGGPGLGPKDEEIFGVFRMLTHLGQVGSQSDASGQPGPFQEALSKIPGDAQEMLRQALAALAAKSPAKGPEEPVLLRLAEHLAIRFALERYERGEVRVNAVRQMLERMNQEIDALRKILGAHEEKMAQAGMIVESHAELLDRQFWAAVPETGKRSVLLSEEAWCIPPRNVRAYVEELIQHGEKELAVTILQNYAACIKNPDADARRRTAIGLGELAEVYARSDSAVLVGALRDLGVQLCVERDAELQSLISAAFVHLSQEAAAHRCYPAVQQVLRSLDSLDNQRPAVGQSLRPRLGIEERIPEFVEEVLRADPPAAGVLEVLREMPQPATHYMTTRFNRSGNRKDCDRLVELIRALGAGALSQLREPLRAGPGTEAAEAVGLLSRLDAASVEQLLPGRMREWSRSTHDRLVRLLAAAGAPERGRLLLAAFEGLDPLVMALALDEMGMSGDDAVVPKLLALAEGGLPEHGGPYLRVKAIEALGRLRPPSAAVLLRKLLESKHFMRWAQPTEIRIAAAQALEKIYPEWTQSFLPRSGLSDVDLSFAPRDPHPNAPWLRQRRYVRLRLTTPIQATATTGRESMSLEVKSVNLSGGLAATERHIAPGTPVNLKLGSGMRGLRATVLMRGSRAQDVAFEIVDMDLEERSKLRRLLAGYLKTAREVAPKLEPGNIGGGQLPAQ